MRHLSYCLRKKFNEAYDKIDKLSNFKYTPVFRFNKLQDIATDFGSKDTGTPFLTIIKALIYNLIDSFLFLMPQSNS